MWRSCDIVCYLCIITEVVIFVIFITGEASPRQFQKHGYFPRRFGKAFGGASVRFSIS